MRHTTVCRRRLRHTNQYEISKTFISQIFPIQLLIMREGETMLKHEKCLQYIKSNMNLKKKK